MGGAGATEVSYSKFIDQVTAGEIKSVTYSGETMLGKTGSGSTVTAYGAPIKEDITAMKAKGRRCRLPPAAERLAAVQRADLLVAHAAAHRRVDFLHPPDAVGLRQGHGLRQVEGQAADREARPRHV